MSARAPWGWRFVRGRKGQSTVEYILLLSTSVALFLILKRAIVPFLERVSLNLGNSIEQSLSRNLHRLPFR